jgi:hypothetical protein
VIKKIIAGYRIKNYSRENIEKIIITKPIKVSDPNQTD